MYLPEIYQAFSERFPSVFRDYKQLGISTRQAGPLDEKTQDLVKLGIAIGTNSQGAVMSHTRKCLAAGSTPEEIIHVVLLALTTTGFPNMIAALRGGGYSSEPLRAGGLINRLNIEVVSQLNPFVVPFIGLLLAPSPLPSILCKRFSGAYV
jgi:4-carboxymuconolactone decarboxylase